MKTPQLLTLGAGLALVGAVSGLAFPGPSPTNDALVRWGEGVSPMTTQAPAISEDDLRKRVPAGMNVCGFYDLSSDNRNTILDTLSCAADRTCNLVPRSRNDIPGMMGCCKDDDYSGCEFKSACYDLTEIPERCNSPECATNTFNLLCNQPTAPFCFSWTFPAEDIKYFGCGPGKTSTYFTMSTTGTTRLDNTLVTFTANAATAPFSALLFQGDPNNAQDQTFGGSRPSETAAAATPTPAADSDDETPTDSSEGGGLNAGAIAGGVVGGLAGGAALTAIAVFFFLKRRKQMKAQEAAQQYPQGPQDGQQQNGNQYYSQQYNNDYGRSLSSSQGTGQGYYKPPIEMDSNRPVYEAETPSQEKKPLALESPVHELETPQAQSQPDRADEALPSRGDSRKTS